MERQRLRTIIRERKRTVAPRVVAAWQAARAAHDGWAALVAEEDALLGEGSYDLLVGAFLQPTTHQGAPLEWAMACRRAGLLDE